MLVKAFNNGSCKIVRALQLTESLSRRNSSGTPNEKDNVYS